MHKRVRVILSGRVQLVMFRDFARRKARKLKLTGWVRNLRDNTVEVLAEGREEKLKVFLEHLSSGPLLAEVAGMDTKWWPSATGEFKDFVIRYDGK